MGVPISSTTVLAMLNLAPDVIHHLSRIWNRFPISSLCLRYTVVSSARCSSSPGIWNLLSRLVQCSMFANGSIARLNSRQDKGSPCQTPLNTWKRVLVTLLIMTTVSTSL